MTKAILWINAVAIALLIIEALIHLDTARSLKATALLIGSLAVVAYPVLRFGNDTVPAGQGP